MTRATVTPSPIPTPSLDCPLCRTHLFQRGTTGWHGHVGKLSNHPNWHPEVEDYSQRAYLFELEFPDFFADSLTPSVRRKHTGAPPPRTTPQPRRYQSSQAQRAASAAPSTAQTPTQPPPPGFRFCPHCGERLAASPAASPAE